MYPYKEVFNKAEQTLKNISSLSESDFKKAFNEYRFQELRILSDNEYYLMLVDIVFYSGFKAETVTKKLDVIHDHLPSFKSVSLYDDQNVESIMSDKNMIRNKRKIKACINIAKEFKILISEYGSFINFINSYGSFDKFENILLLKEDIESKFDYIGGITSYHVMTDLGLPVLKPDRVIVRLFKRLGLIQNGCQLLKSLIHGRKFSEATGHPIRYIDIILVKLGQVGIEESMGIETGICLKNNPQCEKCLLREYCSYEG
jgi:DNA-3-methyladenine glycosylase I